MKTFIDYLKELLIIIGFSICLMWLCSCGSRKQRVIEQIHAYEDSVTAYKKKCYFATDIIERLKHIRQLSKYEKKVDSLKLELYR